jgi:D-alanyl-D-alanine carboxypeptidase (penicillin-binding protein 5/6)
MSYRRIIIAFLSFLLLSTNSSVYADPAPVAPVPAIAARAYILIDANSGQTLTQLEGDSRIEPASLTKLMTAYLVFGELRAGKIGMDTEAVVSNKAWRMEGSRTFLEVGKKIPVETLLKGMIIQSGNDATVTLAELIGGSEEAFVSMMNQQAQALGMRNTH